MVAVWSREPHRKIANPGAETQFSAALQIGFEGGGFLAEPRRLRLGIVTDSAPRPGESFDADGEKRIRRERFGDAR